MPTTLWTLVRPSFDKYKNHPAWICREKKGRRVITYGELGDASLTIANRLRESGIVAGDTVGITAPNGPEWTAGALATWKLGANVAPIHIGNSDHDIAAQVDAVNPSVMLVSGRSIDSDGALSLDLEPSADAIQSESSIEPAGATDDVAVRIYTSGSTGTPKVVRLSHGNHVSNVLAACKLMDFNASDRFISLLPFSHAMGLTANLLLPLYCGSGIVAPRVLAASEILAALEEEKISVVIAVPRLFRNVMQGMEKKFDEAGPAMQAYLGMLRHSPLFIRRCLNAPIRKKFGGNIKAWVSGGSHLDSRISHYYHQLGLPLRQGYGLTETAPLTSVQESFDPVPESVGKPVENVEVKINNPDENGIGEVWIKGPNVMLGYEDPEQNAAAFEDGYFKSGDIGRIDQDGRIILTGRSKRLIVTEAGKNVYPEELETLLERNPAVKEAGVFELDMRPVCILAMDGEDNENEARKAISELNELVSSHSRISRFAITDELPRTALGKTALQDLPGIFAAKEVH